MDHFSARDLLSSYLDGEVPAGTRAQVADHLEQCPECRDELADLRHLKALLQAVPAVEPPRSFVLSPTVATTRPGWLRPVRYATAVAAVLLIALLAGDLISQSFPPAPRLAASSRAVTATPAGPPGTSIGPAEVVPTVAGAAAQRDMSRPEPTAPATTVEDARPPSGFRIAELVVLLALLGLGTAWLVGWSRARSTP